MKQYYINYDETANINYCFLFALYCIAEPNKIDRLNNVITYNSQKDLADKIKDKCNYNISSSTISRILKSKDYELYFSKSEKENKIILNTCFKKGKAASNKFVILTEAEIYFLLEQDNKQLNKYYLYLKYYCGFSKSKRIDTTANQILTAIGYSANCGNNKDNLCKYNSLLLDKGFISIEKARDSKGYCRNVYKMNFKSLWKKALKMNFICGNAL